MLFKSSIENERMIKNVWKTGCFMLFFALLYSHGMHLYFLNNKPLYLPPNLESGATIQQGKIYKYNVFTYTFYIFQNLNKWADNGTIDYEKKIAQSKPFITNNYFNALKANYFIKQKNGELGGRTKSLILMDGHLFTEKSVDVNSDGSWTVYLDVAVRETLYGEQIKKRYVRYSMRVIYDFDNPEYNKWGLKLDGLVSKPYLLKKESKK